MPPLPQKETVPPTAMPGSREKPGERREFRRPERPPLEVFSTTLWTYPSQHYQGPVTGGRQGDQNYVGATPSWVIWQLLSRYTRERDLLVDPMCGSGTSLDVAQDLGRRARGFDLVSRRPDIEAADARELPLDDESADFYFVDPPYSTHIDYSDDPRCLGKLDAGGSDHGEAYYQAMAEVFQEAHRVLKNRRYLGVYISDSWRKKKGGPAGSGGGEFMPIGFRLFSLLERNFKPIDIVAVIRGNQKLSRGSFHKEAVEQNYFLRGFNYLLIFKKVEDAAPPRSPNRPRTRR